MFSLRYQFAVPDVLYFEELDGRHTHLLSMGLQTRTLSELSVERVQTLSRKYARPVAMTCLPWRWPKSRIVPC